MGRRATATKTDRYGLLFGPIDVGPSAWYYEMARGLTVVCEVRAPSGDHVATAQCRIPWSLLRASLERKDRSLRRDRSARRKQVKRAA